VRAGGLRAAAFAAVLTLTAGCSTLPALVPAAAPAEQAALLQQCLAFYPQGEWAVVHTLDADLPFGRSGSFLGATASDPASGGVRSALMAQEGLVLLDQSYGPAGLIRHRALPPLDGAAMSLGMAQDIELLFVRPRGEGVAAASAPGRPWCRWRRADGGVVELRQVEPETWEQRRYSRSGSLEREAVHRGPRSGGFSQRVELSAPGLGGYTLRLERVE